MVKHLFSVLAASFATARAGSGCNEAVKDLGPWIDRLEIRRTEEGSEVSLELAQGAVAASSTESVELLLLKGGEKRHVVLPKLAVRKAVLELRSEEDLLFGGDFALEATLAEYNGNAHGPEKMVCSVSEGRCSCQRSGPEGVAVASMRGTAHVSHGVSGGVSHGVSHAPKSVQLMPRAVLLEVGDTCVLGTSSCPKGSTCQVGPGGFICQVPQRQPEALTMVPLLVRGLLLLLALATCCCLGRLWNRPEARAVDALPKVVGKAELDLPVRKAYQETSDSDDEYRVF